MIKRVALVILILLAASGSATAFAQEERFRLLRSSPTNGATLSDPPERIILTFNQPLRSNATEILLLDSAGEVIVRGPGRVSPSNPQELRFQLPRLPARAYSIQYAAASEIGQVAQGRLDFTIIAEPISLTLLSPSDGQSLPPGEIPIQFAVEGLEPPDRAITTIRVFVDGEAYADLQATSASIPELPSGVYTLEAGIIREGTLLQDTMQSATIAVRSNAEAPLASPPPPEPPTTLAEAATSVIGVLLLLGIGVILGRLS